MHTKFSVHQKWINLVCMTWGPHEDRNVKKRTWEIIEIIEIIGLLLINANQILSTILIGPPGGLPRLHHLAASQGGPK